MCVVFILLFAGPMVARKFIDVPAFTIMDLMQPVGLNNNDTTDDHTGFKASGGGGSDAEETSSLDRRMFSYY
jgi:1,3-beta-glucan synthase